jgi:DNA-dependent protein kinase catalytic subunit
MIQHAARDATVKKVEDQYQKIPRNLLQRGIESLDASPEAYLFIRNHFARSLATFNICSYIIGIGDRHLDNFLLNQAEYVFLFSFSFSFLVFIYLLFFSGRLIGIDFGHAFGTATQFLPIPELMPFRLTRQLTQFLQPLDSEGLLNHNMVHALTGKKFCLIFFYFFV